MTPKDAAYKRAHRVLKIGIVSNLVASPSEQTPHKVRKGWDLRFDMWHWTNNFQKEKFAKLIRQISGSFFQSLFYDNYAH